jgi:hypothetical protein
MLYHTKPSNKLVSYGAGICQISCGPLTLPSLLLSSPSLSSPCSLPFLSSPPLSSSIPPSPRAFSYAIRSCHFDSNWLCYQFVFFVPSRCVFNISGRDVTNVCALYVVSQTPLGEFYCILCTTKIPPVSYHPLSTHSVGIAPPANSTRHHLIPPNIIPPDLTRTCTSQTPPDLIPPHHN